MGGGKKDKEDKPLKTPPQATQSEDSSGFASASSLSPQTVMTQMLQLWREEADQRRKEEVDQRKEEAEQRRKEDEKREQIRKEEADQRRKEEADRRKEEADLTDVIFRIQDYVKQQTNESVRRLKFSQVKQEQGESFSNFFIRLQEAAQLVDLCKGKDCVKHQIRHAIVVGVQDEKLRKDILEMDSASTLEQVAQACEVYESVQEFSKEIEPSQASVFAMSAYKKDKKANTQGHGEQQTASGGPKSKYPPKQQCNRCGYKPHAKDVVCPATDTICHNCEKGHFAKVCWSKGSNEKKQTDMEMESTIRSITAIRKPTCTLRTVETSCVEPPYPKLIPETKGQCKKRRSGRRKTLHVSNVASNKQKDAPEITLPKLSMPLPSKMKKLKQNLKLNSQVTRPTHPSPTPQVAVRNVSPEDKFTRVMKRRKKFPAYIFPAKSRKGKDETTLRRVTMQTPRVVPLWPLDGKSVPQNNDPVTSTEYAASK